MKLLTAVILALFMAVASQALAAGCFEPCPDGEVYSEDAEMCVKRSEVSS